MVLGSSPVAVTLAFQLVCSNFQLDHYQHNFQSRDYWHWFNRHLHLLVSLAHQAFATARKSSFLTASINIWFSGLWNRLNLSKKFGSSFSWYLLTDRVSFVTLSMVGLFYFSYISLIGLKYLANFYKCVIKNILQNVSKHPYQF